MRRTSLDVKAELLKLRDQQTALLDEHGGNPPAGVAAQMQANDSRLEELLDEFQALQQREAGASANQADLQRIFRGGGAPMPTHDGSRLSTPGSGLGAAIFGAGFDLARSPRVHVESFLPAIGASADYATGSAGHYAASYRTADIAATGQDRRWLWQALSPTPVDAGTTSIDDWTQNARTLTGTVERALGASTEKAVLDLGLAFANAPLKTLAVVIEDIPTQLMASQAAAQAWFNAEAQFQLFKALDAHVYSQITAASPAAQAWDTDVLTTTRKGIATMRAAGGAPSMWAMSPDDGATISLLQDNENRYLFPPAPLGIGAQMLWGLPVVESPSVTGDILLLEPGRLGVLLVGGITILADPYSKMSTNLIDIRFELNALLHIRQIDAALSVANSAS